MIKCCHSCVPTCQHCVYAVYEEIEIDDCIFRGEAIGCRKNPEKEISGAYYCKNFHCFKAKIKDKSFLKGVIG